MPNIVFITIDECQAKALSSYGNPHVDTPAARTMADTGVRFERCFTAHPKCVPSRAALLTGRIPHIGGHRTLPGFELARHERSLITELKTRGYATGMFGKNHTVEDHLLPELFDEYRRNMTSTAERRQRDTTLHLDDPAWRAFYRGDWRDSFDDDHQDRYDVDQGLGFLRRRRDKPFFALFNLSLPHPVYYGMSPFIESIRARDIEVPSRELLDHAPPTLRKYRTVYDAESLDDTARVAIRAAYFSMASYVDHQVYRILEELAALGLDESTIVVYTSDHGDFAGDHGAFEKYDTLFYDSITHIPLFMRWPGGPAGAVVGALVESIDIAPTIYELLGIVPTYTIHGTSLVSVATGVTKSHKEYVFCEGGVEPKAADNAPNPDSPECRRMLPDYYLKQWVLYTYPETMYRSKMVRSDTWKFVFRLSGEHELYDLEHDPDELSNVYGPGHPMVPVMQEALLRRQIEIEPEDPPIVQLFA